MPSTLSRRLLLAALPAAATALAMPAAAQSCCGPITPDGQRLVQRLDASGVDHLWLPHEHVNWETGEVDTGPHARPATTHCSAFVASFAKQLGIYILRPPEHSSVVSQRIWALASRTGECSGGRRM